MNVVSRVFLVCVVLTSCALQQSPRKRTIAAPTLSCDEANRLAYRTVTTLGYSIVSLQVATPSQPGYILARKEGAKDGKVTISRSREPWISISFSLNESVRSGSLETSTRQTWRSAFPATESGTAGT